MNKTIAITAIVLVAVVMGMSSVVPMMQKAYAGAIPPDPPEPPVCGPGTHLENGVCVIDEPTEGACPGVFDLTSIATIAVNSLAARAEAVDKADGVADGFVCIETISTSNGDRFIIIDNKIPIARGSTCDPTIPPGCNG